MFQHAQSVGPYPCCTAVLVVLLLLACGKEGNVADCETGQANVPCEEPTDDEKARSALDDGDYDTAIKLLDELILEEPEVYGRYTVVSAAYAARAGVSIFEIAKANFGEGGGIFQQMNAFLPTPAELGPTAYPLAVDDMDTSVERLQAIPENLRSEDSDSSFGSSAVLQLTLYQSAYSVMYLNQFANPGEDGEIDIESLQEMSEEDALEVLNNLAEAGQLQGEDGELSGSINEALADIESQEGDGTKEKLIEFLQSSE